MKNHKKVDKCCASKFCVEKAAVIAFIFLFTENIVSAREEE